MPSALLAGSIIDEQIDLETKALTAGVARYKRLAKDAVDRGDGASLKPVERYLLHWFEPVTHLIKREQDACRKGEYGSGRIVYGEPIQWLTAEQMAVIVMHEAVGMLLCKEAGVEYMKLAYAVGATVVAQAELATFKKKNPEALKELAMKLRGKFNRRKVNWWAKKNLDDPKIHRTLAVQLGSALLKCLRDGASAGDYMNEVMDPAFRHYTERRNNGRRYGMIEMNPRVGEEIDRGHEVRQSLRPRYLPMIVQPYPWLDMAGVKVEGGYVRIRTPFMSKPTREQKAAMKAADMSRVYDCVNALSSTKWRLNAQNADAVEEVWESGGNRLGVPPKDDIPMPPRIESTDAREINAAKHARVRVYRQNIENRSLRVEFLSRMDVAKTVRNREAWWLPHQLDFRGRGYPIPPHLNHHGDDLCRGMMEFSDAVACEDDGNRWILIHAANCYGHDKLPFDDRVDWSLKNIKNIARSAKSPQDFDWWQKAENPWQFLAACRALMDKKLASHLPVQLDGTCNGLQHYSALGRDEVGAAQVNMVDADAPSDVYTAVTAIVLEMVRDDAKAGNELSARMVPMITRSLVKQPVMTSVYGVTMVGARDQIRARLFDAGIRAEELFQASRYLSMVVMRAIAKVCIGASETMAWLKKCASLIANDGHPVSWTTPLGLPVVQPYRNYSTVQINTMVQCIRIIDEDKPCPVKVAKHITSFPPNFIHSIDATHMMMTARECRKAGIAFAEVHDSFWTHAEHATTLGKILRDTFVELHSQDILGNLIDQFREKHPTLDFPDPPASGTFDITKVRNSRYFFS